MRRDDLNQFVAPLVHQMQEVDPVMISKLPSMSKALVLCQNLSGKDDAQFYGPGGIVEHQAQWSRIMGAGQHHFPHDKLNLFMDMAGNEVPMLWLLHSRGYDLHSLHRLESETEKKLRLAMEENAALRRVLTGVKA